MEFILSTEHITIRKIVNLSMQVQVDIGFDQLLEIVRSLPQDQLIKLKSEIDNSSKQVDSSNSDDLRSFLLQGPVYSKEQLDTIAQTRKSINEWRTK